MLALHNPEASTKISADASSFGLGAVLLQQHGNEWRPVVYVSRALSETERRYAQIDKETLPVTWSCESFSDYVPGLLLFRSNHKPHIPLFNTKCLNSGYCDFDQVHVHYLPWTRKDVVPVSREPSSHVQVETLIHSVIIPSLSAGAD